MIQSRDYKTLDGQSALYNEIVTEIDANGPYYIKTGTNPIKLQDGTMANPALTFESDTKNDTGIYKLTAPNGLAISSSGYERLKVHDSFTESFSQIRQIDGSATLPCITFSSDTDTGIYREGTNAIGFTTNGVQKFHIHAAHLEAFQPLRLPNGSVSTPALNFSNDQDCGLYRAGTNDIRIAANGQDVAEFDASSFVLYKPMLSSFQAYKLYRATSTQTITRLTNIYLDYATIVTEQSASEITRSVVSSKTRYTINQAGMYLIIADMNATGLSSGSLLYLWMNLNDDTAAGDRYMFSFNYSTDYQIFQGHTILKLSATNFLNFVAYTGTTGYNPTFPLDTTKNTYLQIYRLS